MPRMKTQLQKVDVVGQAQEHGIPPLRLLRAPRCLGRQFPLDDGEDALDLRALAVTLAREATAHPRPDALDLPASLTALGRDDAVGSDDISHVLVVTLAVELRIREHQADRRHLMGGAHQRAQGRAVVVWPLPSSLRQHAAAQDIDDDRPLTPMPPGKPFAAVGAPVDEERADGARRESGRVDGDNSPLSLAPTASRTSGNRDEHLIEHLVADAAHEAVQSSVVRCSLQAERLAQVRMLGEPHFSFAERPVLEAHQAQDGHQLWLREGMLGELAAVRRHDFLHHRERSLGKEH